MHPINTNLFCTTSRDYSTRIYDLTLKPQKLADLGNPHWPPGTKKSFAGAAHGLHMSEPEGEGSGIGRCIIVLMGGRSGGHQAAVLSAVSYTLTISTLPPSNIHFPGIQSRFPNCCNLWCKKKRYSRSLIDIKPMLSLIDLSRYGMFLVPLEKPSSAKINHYSAVVGYTKPVFCPFHGATYCKPYSQPPTYSPCRLQNDLLLSHSAPAIMRQTSNSTESRETWIEPGQLVVWRWLSLYRFFPPQHSDVRPDILRGCASVRLLHLLSDQFSPINCRITRRAVSLVSVKRSGINVPVHQTLSKSYLPFPFRQ